MSEKIKVGIIGTGGIARGSHIPALTKHPDVEIAAICDSNEESLKSAAADLEGVRTFTNYDEMLEMDEIDVVDICTPNFLHKDPTVKALKSGKHVLVEKPIARNSEEGAAMVEASRTSGKKLMVAYCWRWHPGARALKRFIDAGDLGEIYYSRVHALRRRGIPNWGVFTQKDKQGGGPLIDIGCHLLDLTLWLMGHPKPVSASGKCYTKFGNRPGIIGARGPWDHTKYTVEDFATGLVRFDNGATLNIESSFAANIEKDTLNTVLLGTEGGCELNPLKIFREERQTLVDLTPVGLKEVNWREAEIFEFIEAIRDDKPVPIPGEEGLMVSRIIDAIYKSSEENREVEIS
ncbi:MAG TPA: Gfo/Idh/MocA family oxidoreductase [Armatimonadota bacterium]|jgi:predicted dehydrogenase